MLNEHIITSDLKGKNLLYHASSFDGAISILGSNKIEARTLQKFKTREINPKYKSDIRGYKDDLFKGVSLTRDSNFKYDVFQFILDGDLIKRDYGKDIMPHDYYNELSTEGAATKSNPERYNSDDGADFESEEFLLGDLNNLRKYIVGIRIVDYIGTSDAEIRQLKNDKPEKYKELLKLTHGLKIYDDEFNAISLNENFKIKLFEKKIIFPKF